MPKKKDTPNILGKMEKPEAEKFKGGRKLIFVPLIFMMPEDEPGVEELIKKYWEQVKEQVEKLQEKLVSINKIYHEFISREGDEGVKASDKMDVGSKEIVKSLINKEANIQALENESLLNEFMDWSKCLSLRLTSEQVFAKLYQFYGESLKKREEHMTKIIDENLGSAEFGILFLREGHRIQFPSDIEVFYVSPPSLDEIKRWLRDKRSASPSPEETT
ncbi:MAG: hypothetical protein PHE15_02935 [Dehalococcoidales bacterium]|nr:hypothetical protein [Dehalococcoidales bacterium]